MRGKHKLLSPGELAQLERSVGLDPTTTQVIVHRTQNSKIAAFIKELPEGGQIVLGVVVVVLTVLIFIVTIVLVSSLVSGPSTPSSCIGHKGVRTVKIGNSDTDWSGMVVCNDGTSYTN